ncbi:MAG: hypothetical protein II238_00565 [Alphaproteobacteria bacterium]|nr:hypothetical protein [Alphaproteobacteria bacterium]
MYKYDLKNNPDIARERHNAQNREWYRKHREQKMEYQRQYRQRKKKQYRPLTEIDLKWSLMTGKSIPVVEINGKYYVDIERDIKGLTND